MYGPTTTPTPSVLAYDDKGKACSWWDCGLQKGQLTELPKFDVVVDLHDVGPASASFPSQRRRVRVDDPQRERVTEHWAHARTRETNTLALGVHVFAEERADGFVGLEIVVDAGTLDPAQPSSWPGALRFNDIRLVLPEEWIQVRGAFGPAGDWYVGPRGLIYRRFALVRKDAALAVHANASAWTVRAGLHVDGHASLGPARHKIPVTKNSRHQRLQRGTGAGPILTDRNSTGGDMVSGYGIVPLGGWEGSANAAKSYADDVWRVLSGHPCAAFHVATGDPILPHEWAKPHAFPLTNGYLRYDDWNAKDLAGSLVGTFGWSRNAPGPKELNPGASSSRAAILAIEKHDGAHLIRALHVLTAAWWYARSFAAGLALRMIACDVVTSQVLNGSNQYLREQGWTRKALATVIALLPPGSERDFYLQQREAALLRLSETILPNGWARAGAVRVEQDGSFSGSDNGEPWRMGMPTEYACAAAWQLSLYCDGLFDLLRCGPLTAISKARADWLLTEALAKMIDGPLTHNGSPPVHAGVVKSGKAEIPVVRGIGRSHDGHSIHEWHALTLAWLWTGEPRFRALLEKIGTPARSMAKLRAHWCSPQDQAPEWSALPKAVFQGAG